MKKQVSQTISACSFYLRNINPINRFLPESTKERVGNAIITSGLDYCNALLYGTSTVNIARLIIFLLDYLVILSVHNYTLIYWHYCLLLRNYY